MFRIFIAVTINKYSRYEHDHVAEKYKRTNMLVHVSFNIFYYKKEHKTTGLFHIGFDIAKIQGISSLLFHT